MSRVNQRSATIKNEPLLHFLKSSIKNVFNEFDAHLSESLEKWSGYSFINFMQAMEENNLNLAIQIYDAVVYTFSFVQGCWNFETERLPFSINISLSLKRISLCVQCPSADS